MVTEEQKEQYETEGYFIVDDLVPPDMFDSLLEAARRVKAKVRSGEVDVFTHWAAPGEPCCIRGLIAPEFGEPIFAEYMMHKPFMDYAHSFLGDELRLGWIDIRTNPHHADFPGGWHRDVGQEGRDVTEESGGG
jgi:hypothetical protein